jgi:hypothetical protein
MDVDVAHISVPPPAPLELVPLVPLVPLTLMTPAVPPVPPSETVPPLPPLPPLAEPSTPCVSSAPPEHPTPSEVATAIAAYVKLSLNCMKILLGDG